MQFSSDLIAAKPLKSVTSVTHGPSKAFNTVCRETDVQALQQRCRQLLRQRDADRLSGRQDMHRLARLEAQCESLGGSATLCTHHNKMAKIV